MKLFEDKIRTENRPASSNENVYKYFDSNSQSKIVELRELLNEWFSNYPDEHKNDLLNSFKNNFYHSFYELFIHEIFHQQGYNLEPHPKLENSEKRPDFLAVKDNDEFYIEATTISYLSELEVRKENFKNKFIDELNKIDSPEFWLVLKELKFKNKNLPKVKLLKNHIQNELQNAISENFHNDTSNIINQNLITFEDDNILLRLTLLKKTDKAKKSNVRPIGMEMGELSIKDADEDSEKIFKNFKQKATRYGVLDKPFFVCLNLDFRFNIQYDVDWSIYSNQCFNSIVPKFTKVSAVLINQISFGNIFHSPKHRLIINPVSINPLNLNKLNLSYENNGNLTLKENIDQILNLRKNEN